MAPTPPAEIARALTAYSSSLRLRWGVRMQKWIIEKHVDDRVGQLLKTAPHPYKSARGHDLADGWRDGYDHVLTVAPELIGNVPLVMQHVADADLWRAGGREALNRRLEEQDEQAERAADKALAHFSTAAASEMYDRLAWGDGRRVAVHDPDPFARAVRHEDGFVIVDRRVSPVAK